MRIKPNNSLTKSARATRSRASGMVTGSPFNVSSYTATSPKSPLSPNQPIEHLESLLALQEVDFHGGKKYKAIKRSNDILDLLDKLKISLLSGRVSRHLIHRLRARIDQEKSGDLSPELLEIVKAIELRAEVELAKYGG